MDSTFYDPDSGEGEAQLGVYVHHARGIHNICIYASQDVYAKLSLTCSPDDAVSTRVAAAGGSDPYFDELLTVAVSASPPLSAVLKCEIWMLSRARNLLEDQLLGFALVPLSSVAAAAGRRLTHDFPLSSTDLFHSPAGTVRLTLSLDSPPTPAGTAAAAALSSSAAGITSEVVILDPADYRRLEPPDVAAAEENRRMVAEYFDIMSPASTATPSLRPAADYYDVTPNSSEKTAAADASSSSSSSNTSAAEAGTPTSNSAAAAAAAESRKLEDDSRRGRKVSVFESPMGSIDVEAEQAAMQQQIVEMYMKSMQQFTESLANMALPPMGLDNPRPDDRGVVIQTQTQTQTQNNNNNNNDNKLDAEEKNKKTKTKNDGSRVFYGSRAFF